MSRVSIRPLGDKVLVQRNEADDITAGGIVLPDSAKEKPKRGTIMGVGAGRMLDTGKRHDQGQESGIGCVEVGEERRDDVEGIARLDKEPCRSGAGSEADTRAPGAFERAQGGGADCDNAPALRVRLPNGPCGVSRDIVGLFMERMILEAFSPNGEKRAETDVQSQFGEAHATGFERFKDTLREVKAGRWSGRRSRYAGIDGLVAQLVLSFVRAADIRRKWDMPYFLEHPRQGDSRGDDIREAERP